ncbi:unnamed protein product [Allacma fusca]|uniref:Uncharacterized protein n=1 Tax=Allacma fusca TaxID=39272 RepID=A0A8J2K9S2_9HEXA|nr:unnamed protein product [Allacma fusca]
MFLSTQPSFLAARPLAASIDVHLVADLRDTMLGGLKLSVVNQTGILSNVTAAPAIQNCPRIPVADSNELPIRLVHVSFPKSQESPRLVIALHSAADKFK